MHGRPGRVFVLTGVFEVARSRIRENSGVFRGGQRPPQPPNSHEFGYSPAKCATSKTGVTPMRVRRPYVADTSESATLDL